MEIEESKVNDTERISPAFATRCSNIPILQHFPEKLLPNSTKVVLDSIGCATVGTALCTKCL